MKKSDPGNLWPIKNPDEMNVVLISLRSSIRKDEQDTLSDILKKELDWDYIYRQAERHRLIPLIYNTLKNASPDLVPERILTKMSKIYVLSTKRSMVQMRELLQVINLFNNHGIPLMPYKGIALSQQLYGDISLRVSSDIDIIVRQKDAVQAKALLLSQGYTPNIPLSPEQDNKFIHLRCEYDLINPHRTTIDIHWQFIPYYYLAPFKETEIWSGLKRISLEGREAVTLSPEILIIALCIHGAKHQWKNLIHICDIAAIIALEKTINWEFIVKIVQEKRIKRILFLGLRLVEVLMQIRLPTEISTKIQKDTTIQQLVSVSLHNIFGEELSHKEDILEALYWISVRECARDKIRVLALLTFKPNHDDWKFLFLPEFLSPLYYIIRPIRLALEYGVKS